MKTILIAINSKYIHTNLAIRLLKVNTDYEVEIKEYTIKDDYSKIIDYLVLNNYDLIGISTYIWNVEYVKKLTSLIKEKLPNIKILLGGPEVSYNHDYFLNNFPIDYIIRNEGEEAFNKLLYNLENNLSLEDVPNLAYLNHENKLKEVDTLNINSPHFLDNDYENRITYIETSRGCPFSCAYCMASLEKKVRFFDLETVKKDILYLTSKGARIFKFLDRTFNTDIKKALEIFDFIIKNHYPNTSFQFEITGDILPIEIIAYLNKNAPKNLFRFEIGIQSTNDYTNSLVNRHQNKEKLFNNIIAIQDAGIIDLHLDLIAGLPKEDISSFEKTFNDVLSLRPKELQLGFLKLLKGTALYNEKEIYKYKYSSSSPYEIISNDSLSEGDIKDIGIVENVLEKYYNSGFIKTGINLILDEISSPFKFFLEFGKYYEEKYSWLNYNLDELITRLIEYLNKVNFINLDEIIFNIKYDYLNHFNIKPKIWWKRIDKKSRNELIVHLHKDKLSQYMIEDLYRYAFIEPFNDKYIIAIYKENLKDVFIIEVKKS